MSPLTVALFLSFALAEIQSGCAGVMPRLPPTGDMKAPRPYHSVRTRAKSAVKVIPIPRTTAKVLTTEEPIFEVGPTSQAPEKQCLNLKERCIDSELLCCKSRKLDNGTLVHIDGFCYIYRGECESRVNFTNYDDYVSTAMKLHKLTWERLNP